MTTEQLTATVKGLQHFLFDVWPYDELYNLGRHIQALDLNDEPGDIKQMLSGRKVDADLASLLATTYQRALDEIDRVLPSIGEGPVVDALLEQLHTRVSFLTRREQVMYEWRERRPINYDEITEREFHEGPDPWNDPEEHWAYVAGDVSFYVGKVVAHIDRYRTRKEGNPDTVTGHVERIRWNDTAARLAYLFHELTAAGWITPPQRQGGPNWSAMARAVHASFEILKDNGEPVTAAAVVQAFKPEGDIDRKGGRNAFKITPRG